MDKTIDYMKRKWGDVGFQKYFRNTGWMFLGKMASMVISFLTTIIIARYIGPSNFGQLSYATSFVAIFSFLASLGMDGVIFRDLIKFQDKKAEILGSAFVIRLVAGIAAALICIIFAIFIPSDDVSRVLIFILAGTFIFNSFQIIAYDLLAVAQSKYQSIIIIAVTLILNILKVGVLLLGKGVIYLTLILLLESILYAVFYLLVYQKKIGYKILDWKFNKQISYMLLRDSWPMIFSSAFALILARIDQVLIKNMIDASAVGVYDAAVGVVEAWYFIPNILVPALYPSIVNAKIVSEKIYNRRLITLSTVLLFISIVVALLTSIFASSIMHIIYGTAYDGGIIILQIYIWSIIGTFVGILLGNYLLTENYRKIIFYTSLIPMVINVILNIVWIPRYGIVGSAYATLISYSLGPISLLLFTQTRKKFTDIVYDLLILIGLNNK